ncbi:MAG: hypothetical protein V3U29_00130, partial [Phycisphaeraceae bacterium]
LQLSQLASMQENLSADTRNMLPRTLGQDPDQLDPADRAHLDELARRQTELATKAAALTRQMQATADTLARQGDQVEDQAAAAALAEAAAISQRQGLAQTMQRAAQSTQHNRLSAASQDQLDAQDVIQRMLGELNQQEQRRREILRRRLTRLVEAIAKLVEQQKQQIDRLQNAQVLAGLDEPLAALRRNTLGVQDQARATRQTVAVADLLALAVAGQADAILSLRDLKREPARAAENQALEHLEAALEKASQMRDQAAAQQVRQQRGQLRKAYLALAQQQDDLHDQVQILVGIAALSRRHRAELVELGHAESDLRFAASELQEQVAQTLIFLHLHERIDTTAATVVSRLRAADIDEAVLADQASIASMLRRMAEALEEPQAQSDDFAGQGGGGGGGGGQPPLVPPVAELKLLRGLQQDLYDRTRRIGGEGLDKPDLDRRALLDLSARQRELAGLGERLIHRMQRRARLGGAPQNLQEPERPSR